MSDSPKAPRIWHGIHDVPVDQQITVTIGPLAMVIAHYPNEWQIGWTRGEVPQVEPSASVSAPEAISDPTADFPDFSFERFLTHGASNKLRLRPLLADRPVVARPDLPLRVPADDEAKIFVSTPLWVRIELVEPVRPLLELPTTRPSDTWFGPDTRRGVVAYSTPTAARLHLDNLPPCAYRAITRVTVRNRATRVLSLERLSVPAPNLALYADGEGGLWTAPLTAVRDSDLVPPRVELDTVPPEEAAQAELVAEPRETNERNVLSRALHVLIG